MKKQGILIALIAFALLSFETLPVPHSEESKTWEASDKAKEFVKQTIVLDFFASPYGVGWNKSEHLHNYIGRAMTTGITGVSATLAATYYTWEDFLKEYHRWRTTMMEKEQGGWMMNKAAKPWRSLIVT